MSEPLNDPQPQPQQPKWWSMTYPEYEQERLRQQQQQQLHHAQIVEGLQNLPREVKATVTKTQKKTNHTFHLILTLLTGGAWGFVWLGVIVWHKVGTKEKAKTTYRY